MEMIVGIVILIFFVIGLGSMLGGDSKTIKPAKNFNKPRKIDGCWHYPFGWNGPYYDDDPGAVNRFKISGSSCSHSWRFSHRGSDKKYPRSHYECSKCGATKAEE